MCRCTSTLSYTDSITHNWFFEHGSIHRVIFTTPFLFCLFPGLSCPPLCQTVICRCHSPSDHIYMVFRERQAEARTHTHEPWQIDKHRKSPQHDTGYFHSQCLEFSWINNIPTCSIVMSGAVTGPDESSILLGKLNLKLLQCSINH